MFTFFGQVFFVFLFYSFIGWLVEKTYERITRVPSLPAPHPRGPLRPIYGFGALIILSLFPAISGWPLWGEFFVFALVLGLYEYVSGAVSSKIFGRRLWDYTGNFLSIHGHIDLAHLVYWGVGALFVVYAVQPRIVEPVLRFLF